MDQNTDTQQQKAHAYALFLLNIRLRTRGELEHKLKEKRYSEAVIAQTLELLQSQRFIDDVRFAEIFVQNLKQYKLFGFYKIRQKLIEKRLPKEIIEETLQTFFEAKEEQLVAQRFLRKYAPLFMTEPENFSYQAKQKLAGKLQSRGFRSDVVSKLLF